jgi:hypothetical protein
MTLTDYLLDLGLIGLVFLQIRGRRLTTRTLLIPVLLVGWAAFNYLHGIPTAGNDLVLVVGAAAAGVSLGVLCALFTSVELGPDGHPFAKAGVAGACLWVFGVGTRLAFQLYVSHGGEATIGRFSASHSITSGQAWVAALILMAMGEALARTGVLALRGRGVLTERGSGVLTSQWAGGVSMMDIGDRAY